MMTWLRERMGRVVVGGVIGFITFVFIFSGVFNPKRTAGIHEGAVAGMVNGEPISIGEFQRELQRRMEFFKSMGGAGLTEEQLKAFRVKEGVFQELVNRKLMTQSAVREGVIVSDEEIRFRIMEYPVFQKEGRFDAASYRMTLEANRLTPALFEKMIREEILLQSWSKYFRSRVKVSDQEVKSEFLVSRDKRNIKYVLLTTEAGRKAVVVAPDEIKKYLSDPARINVAKAQYDGRKETEYKGKTFDQVKEEIARTLIASDKTQEAMKANEKIASEVLPLLSADKKADARINTLLKPYGVQVRSTGLVSRQNRYLPGVGEATELFNDAFQEKSPIQPKTGGKPKLYRSGSWILAALVVEEERPDLAKLPEDRSQIVNQLTAQKERALYDAWVKKLNSKASIERNEAIIGSDAPAPATDA